MALRIAPRSRVAFYLNEESLDGVKFSKAVLPRLKDNAIWEVSRAYAMTECKRTFVSRKLSRGAREVLRQARQNSTPTAKV